MTDDNTSESFGHTDSGNATRLIDNFGEDLRYCHQWGKWLVWDGMRFKPDEADAITRKAMAANKIFADIAEEFIEDYERAVEIRKWARTSESSAKLDAAIKVAKSDPRVVVSPDDLDSNPWALNVRNGTVNLRTGLLERHDRKALQTKLAEVNFAENARAPKWEQFLKVVTKGNKELESFLQQLVGYSLTGSVEQEIFMLLLGDGQNGKSKFVETIRFVLGDYAQQADFSSFLASDSDRVRNDIARMKGARFISASEPNQGRNLDESLMKQLTGGDRITARYLHREFFEFDPTRKLWLVANHMPGIEGTDDGIWRRIVVLPFSVTIPESERDTKLLGKLVAESSGILNWAIQGCLDWQRNGLVVPDIVRGAIGGYRAEMDSMQRFIVEMCETDPKAEVLVSDLYSAYHSWAEAESLRPKTTKQFATSLKAKGFPSARGTGGVRMRQGLSLVTEPALV
ncbi:MAG: hypothetical protein IH867_01865 [Chloroflexi bacterium]|nr:hypothetical protein [Chloroflexota bacterium]